MSVAQTSSVFLRRAAHKASPRIPKCSCKTRNASTTSATPQASDDVVPQSSFDARPDPAIQDQIKSFNPAERARRRKHELPASRYAYRSPKYYRGPLHPHQPPRPSDPASRVFVPGPFSLPRLEETYHSTLAPDLLSLMYTHHPPGTLPGPIGQRLRTWDESSPYHKNRPYRAPRGGPHLPLSKRNITFRNLPRLEKIHVNAFLPDAGKDGDLVSVAAMVVQAITGVRATIYQGRKTIQAFGWYEGLPCAAGVELRGEEMWHFLAKCVDVVMPRVKDFEGVSGRSGDGSGNIAFGFEKEAVAAFPEVEVNYDAYPPRKIPRVNVTCNTTATTDKDARLLMSALGVPFHGKHTN